MKTGSERKVGTEGEVMTHGVVPIAIAEYESRIEKARRLMLEADMDALFLEGGSSLLYFTGLRWGQSDRLTAAIVPARGEIVYVCPTFEESRLRESWRIEGRVRCWQEHESPFEVVSQALADLDPPVNSVGLEPQVRFFVFDGLRAASAAQFVNAGQVTRTCRAVKSPAEIALIQRAMDITMAAYRQVIPLLREGITQDECRKNASTAHHALGAAGGIDFQFGPATALPHGSKTPQQLKQGDVVLMDGGCTVEGYHSDISRTIVYGEPTARHREIWELEKRAQAAGFEAARVGAPCEAVDAAARKVIIDAGYGPDYQLPGLPHRTGHGIGLDIHEAENVVRGNTTPLAPGMCFSNEPMMAIEGEFGVRLEDCVYMSGEGPRWFTQPSPSIEEPFD